MARWQAGILSALVVCVGVGVGGDRVDRRLERRGH
jgi:hypothetical protein